MQVANILRSAAFLGQIFEDYPESNPNIETLAILPSIKDPRWIIPLKDKELFISSLALYQPSLVRAKLLKKMTVLAAKGGFSNLAIRNRAYFQRNDESIKKIFKRDDLYYALFTGTEGCHRKVTVQVMDEEGIILGYIKISDNENIDRLLKNEAEKLGDLFRLEIRTGLFPKVIYHGPMNGVNILVLDTLKSVHSKFRSKLSDAHIDFLSEIFVKTARDSKYKESVFAKGLRKRVKDLEVERLSKLSSVVNFIEDRIGDEKLPFGICHRDFTPWNTFFHNNKLYVFDWEYAEREYPPLFDVFHFIVQDGVVVRHLKPKDLLKRVLKNEKMLSKYSSLVGIKDELSMSLLLCYLLDISLLYIEREKGNLTPTTSKTLNIWKEMMKMIVNGS